MKNLIRSIFFTFTLFSLLSSGGVFAEWPIKSADVLATQEPTATAPKNCANSGKEKHLEKLKADLKLDPNQEAAWTTWASAIQGDHKAWEEKRKDMESWAGLSVPERMEKQLAFSKEHIAKLEARIAATKTFYDTLTPEQRKVMDNGFFFKHRNDFQGMKNRLSPQ